MTEHAAEEYHLNIWFDKNEKMWIARCAEIQCCMTYSESRREAIDDCYDAIQYYLEYAASLNIEHPVPDNSLEFQH